MGASLRNTVPNNSLLKRFTITTHFIKWFSIQKPIDKLFQWVLVSSQIYKLMQERYRSDIYNIRLLSDHFLQN